jgi:uncharacterized protein (TIGR03435 family)
MLMTACGARTLLLLTLTSVQAVGIGFSPVRVSAQSAPTPRFDVASVKPNHSGAAESSSIVIPGGRYSATNVTVRQLVKSAYGLHDDQIVGGPDWIDKDRFDIVAKASGFATASGFRDQARLMLRPLLAERFLLVVRHEPRDLPVYALLPARPGGGFGPQFRPSPRERCSGEAEPMGPARDAPEPGMKLPCGAEVYSLGHLAARAMSISNLTLNISRWADRVVVDRTGLDGTFDWDVQWSPEVLTADTTAGPAGPGLFDAIRDQTGFRLERQRATVDVLVIERMARPEPD